MQHQPQNTAYRRTPNFKEDQYYKNMKQTMKSHASKAQDRQLARMKALQGYVTIGPDLKKRFNSCKSWKEVFDLHKEFQPGYDEKLIYEFMKIYHKEAKEMHLSQRLSPDLYFMLELS